MKTQFTKLCLICGTSFSYYKYLSQEKRGPRVTCSEKCRLTLVSQKLKGRLCKNAQNQQQPDKWTTKHCKFCGAQFFGYKLRTQSFCSIQCKAKWQKENLIGKNNPNWKPIDQRKPFRSVSHKVRKDTLRERSFCEHCKGTEKLQIHHKDRNRSNNVPDNLLVLCLKCHSKEHERNNEFDAARLIENHPQAHI